MNMSLDQKHPSPLRYPGGKTKLIKLLQDIILLNNLENCTFYELYAGGAGASLGLLFSGICDKIVLNDLDYHIFSFWYSILSNAEDFIRLLIDTEVNVENWMIQKAIYDEPENHSYLEVGFSTFFLNRTSRSGILHKSGPIGGFEQTGNYKIDVRYNKNSLAQKIKLIAQFKDKIEIYQSESILLLENFFGRSNQNKQFFFLDPPYYLQGERLYLNSYEDKDHERLRDVLSKNRQSNWFLTYDNCQRINELYTSFRQSNYLMSYTLQKKRKTKEIFVFSDNLYLPKSYKQGKTSHKLIVTDYANS